MPTVQPASWTHNIRTSALATLHRISSILLTEIVRNSFYRRSSLKQSLQATAVRSLPPAIREAANSGTIAFMRQRLAVRDAATNFQNTAPWAKSTVDQAVEMIEAAGHYAAAFSYVDVLADAIEVGDTASARRALRTIATQMLRSQLATTHDDDAQLVWEESLSILEETGDLLGIDIDRDAIADLVKQGRTPENTVIDTANTNATDVDPDRSFFPQAMPTAAPAHADHEVIGSMTDARTLDTNAAITRARSHRR